MDKILKRLKALADKNRLEIIKLLLKKNYCVSALAKRLNISESAVSQQLKILREADLVMGEKKGYYVHYLVKKENIKQISDYIINLVESKDLGQSYCHENND
ncbi:MAG: metalloregulator ArsR/SmtB family transcription factor [Halanaerobiales bacterium]